VVVAAEVMENEEYSQMDTSKIEVHDVDEQCSCRDEIYISSYLHNTPTQK
jgi:hypothetical protein